MDTLEALSASSLPLSMSFAWSELSYQEKQAGGETLLIFGLAIVLVFLVLAAQYESWSIPTIIMLTVPTAIIGIVWGVMALKNKMRSCLWSGPRHCLRWRCRPGVHR